MLGLDALVLQKLEEPVRPAIDIRASHDLVAGLQQPQDNIQGSHSTSNSVGVVGIADLGQVFLFIFWGDVGGRIGKLRLVQSQIEK